MATKITRWNSFNKYDGDSLGESEMRPRSSTWSETNKKPPIPRQVNKDGASREPALSRNDKSYLQRQFQLGHKAVSREKLTSKADQNLINSLQKQIQNISIPDDSKPQPKSILKKPLRREQSLESDPGGKTVKFGCGVRSSSHFDLSDLEKPTLMSADRNGNVFPLGRRRASAESSISSSNIRRVIRDELLECTICLDRLKFPKMLRCMHTFCLQCLLEVVSSEQMTSSFLCPVCRETIPVPEDGLENLPTNIYVLKLLDLVGPKTLPVYSENNEPPESPSTDSSSPPTTPGVLPDSFVKRKNFCSFKVHEQIRDLVFTCDNSYLVVACADAIRICDLSGRVLRLIRHLSLAAPSRVAVGTNFIAVIDRMEHNVKTFSLEGDLLGKTNEACKEPMSIGVNSLGEVYIASNKGEVSVFSKKLDYLREFPVSEVYRPSHMAFTRWDELIISDSWDNEIKAFDSFGNLKFMYSPRNNTEGSKKVPFNPIAADKSGMTFVADSLRSRVHVVDTHGRFCGCVATKAEGVCLPVAMATSGCGYLALADSQENIKIYKYRK